MKIRDEILPGVAGLVLVAGPEDYFLVELGQQEERPVVQVGKIVRIPVRVCEHETPAQSRFRRPG